MRTARVVWTDGGCSRRLLGWMVHRGQRLRYLSGRCALWTSHELHIWFASRTFFIDWGGGVRPNKGFVSFEELLSEQALVLWPCFMTSIGQCFSLLSLPVLCKNLTFCSHFKDALNYNAWYGNDPCRQFSLLAKRKSIICSPVLHHTAVVCGLQGGAT